MLFVAGTDVGLAWRRQAISYAVSKFIIINPVRIQDQNLEATIIEANMAEIVATHKEQPTKVRTYPQWPAALSGSVRTVATYLIIIQFLAINWMIAWVIMAEDGITISNLRAALDADFMSLVSCVVAFWFGNRTFGKRKT